MAHRASSTAPRIGARRESAIGVFRVIGEELSRNWQLYILVALPVLYIAVFRYVPMYGAIIAFKKFSPALGYWNSPWVGLRHFARFFSSYNFWPILRNTLEISLYQLIVGFPIPVILALIINASEKPRLKKIAQMATYAPYLLSTAIVVGMLQQLLSQNSGVVNAVIESLGGKRVSFLSNPALFSTIYVLSGVWQTAGYTAVIYIAALSGIDPALHEAAKVDGAGKLRRIVHIDLPGIMPTVTVVLLLTLGNLMSVGFEKVFLLQNPVNIERSEIIDTYIYRVGIGSSLPDFSYATAIGLFNSVVNFVLLLLADRASKRASGSGLF
jgi:ABC-type polysaccharide transport system, permease component